MCYTVKKERTGSMLDNYIESHKDELIQQTQKLIQIPSVISPSTNSKEPFGSAINDALEYVLNIAKDFGFRTKNVDGYCGYIEFGDGDVLLGI